MPEEFFAALHVHLARPDVLDQQRPLDTSTQRARDHTSSHQRSIDASQFRPDGITPNINPRDVSQVN